MNSRAAAGIARLVMPLGIALTLLAVCSLGCSDEAKPDKLAELSGPYHDARFALGSAPDSLDPRAASSTANFVVVRQIYESLLEYDYTARPLAVAPLLAESWTTSADGLTWTFTMRSDAAFYDPEDPPLWPDRTRAVTAHDVVYSWLLQADETDGGHCLWAFQGLIPGLDRFNRELAGASEDDRAALWDQAMDDGVEGLRAIDDKTLEVTLAYPSTEFLYILATSFTAVVPREAVERHGAAAFANHPVGSGPYFAKEWIPKSRLVLWAVPDWRGQPHPDGDGPLPSIGEVVLEYVAEGSTRELKFLAGDIVRLSPNPDALDGLIEDGKPAPALAAQGVRLERAAVQEVNFFGFGMNDPVVGVVPGDVEGNERRRKLRHALAHAIPYERWQRVMRSEHGATPLERFVPPSVPTASGAPVCEARRFDLARAKQLLAEAGYPGGEGLPALRFDMSTESPVDIKVADFFIEAFAQIGVECTAAPHTWSSFQQLGRSGGLQLFMRGWKLDWADAANFLVTFVSGHGENFTQFADADFDAAFIEFRQLPHGAARIAKGHELLAMLHSRLPGVPLDQRSGYLLVHPWLNDPAVHPFDSLAVKYYRIED